MDMAKDGKDDNHVIISLSSSKSLFSKYFLNNNNISNIFFKCIIQ